MSPAQTWLRPTSEIFLWIASYQTRRRLAKRWTVHPEDPSDSCAALVVETKNELRRLFVDRFFFGCEGDDPVMPSAFDEPRNPGRVRFRAVFGSDIGQAVAATLAADATA